MINAAHESVKGIIVEISVGLVLDDIEYYFHIFVYILFRFFGARLGNKFLL